MFGNKQVYGFDFLYQLISEMEGFIKVQAAEKETKLTRRAYYPLQENRETVDDFSKTKKKQQPEPQVQCQTSVPQQSHLEEEIRINDIKIQELTKENKLLKLKLYNWELYPKQKEWENQQKENQEKNQIQELTKENKLLKLKLYNWELYPKQKQWEKKQEENKLKSTLEQMEEKVAELEARLASQNDEKIRQQSSNKSISSNTLEKTIKSVNNLQGSSKSLKQNTDKIIQIFDKKCAEDHEKLEKIQLEFVPLLKATIKELQWVESQVNFEQIQETNELLPLQEQIFLDSVNLKTRVQKLSQEGRQD